MDEMGSHYYIYVRKMLKCYINIEDRSTFCYVFENKLLILLNKLNN